jgi:hypothetical protein
VRLVSPVLRLVLSLLGGAPGSAKMVTEALEFCRGQHKLLGRLLKEAAAQGRVQTPSSHAVSAADGVLKPLQAERRRCWVAGRCRAGVLLFRFRTGSAPVGTALTLYGCCCAVAVPCVASPSWTPGDEELEQAALAVSLLARLPGALHSHDALLAAGAGSVALAGSLSGLRDDMWQLWQALAGHDKSGAAASGILVSCQGAEGGL